ncbi:alpha/beta fold hydrolase [Rhodospira trueperi]|uniref:Haloacetate dehalogenase n=1 Tax=Rhodospira trueperi TaxID=69960 RepID=A0A1G6WVK5_9PROT|nr:alpha/beta hydrolase [Rhodospira trueperi]SDD69922.1 haloacetate dehalogenase [Rhodospira trueperi]
MTRFEDLDRKHLPGFERRFVTVAGQDVLALIGGDGPPLLMLHGDPQTHLCWHRIAPRLAETHTVVLTDIRGRGETHKPASPPDGAAYAKRAMGAEQLGVMRSLGFPAFALVGHDRGARVAHRLALDHPETVTRLAVMDIIPALDFYETATSAVAQDYFYFFFLTQPPPLPERLIAGAAEAFMSHILLGLSNEHPPYDAEVFDAYIAASTTPQAIAAMCACFRAGLSIDCRHDRADRKAGRSIACPTLVLWGEHGVIGRHFDVPSVWAKWCRDPTFAPMPSGHFIPEEAPDAVLDALTTFLAVPA